MCPGALEKGLGDLAPTTGSPTTQESQVSALKSNAGRARLLWTCEPLDGPVRILNRSGVLPCPIPLRHRRDLRQPRDGD